MTVWFSYSLTSAKIFLELNVKESSTRNKVFQTSTKIEFVRYFFFSFYIGILYIVTQISHLKSSARNQVPIQTQNTSDQSPSKCFWFFLSISENLAIVWGYRGDRAVKNREKSSRVEKKGQKKKEIKEEFLANSFDMRKKNVNFTFSKVGRKVKKTNHNRLTS